jgi:Tfp pilus assembly protein PilO
VKFDIEKIRELLLKNLVLVITVFVMLVLLVLVYLPKLSRLSEVKKEFEKQAEKLRSNHELLDRLVKIGSDHQAAKVELNRLYDEHGGQRKLSEIVHNLTTIGATLDFKLNSHNQSSREKERFLTRVPINLDIDSSYRSFAEYLDGIVRKSKLLDIRRIEIHHDKESYPRHRANLLLDAYFLEERGGEE